MCSASGSDKRVSDDSPNLVPLSVVASRSTEWLGGWTTQRKGKVCGSVLKERRKKPKKSRKMFFLLYLFVQNTSPPDIHESGVGGLGWLKKDVIHAIAGSTLPAFLPVGEHIHTYLYRPDLNPHIQPRLCGKYQLMSWLYPSLLPFWTKLSLSHYIG